MPARAAPRRPLPHARRRRRRCAALVTSENEAIAGGTDAFAIGGNGHAEPQYFEVERPASGWPILGLVAGQSGG